MAGIVAVAGHADPEFLVRLGALPMLRRPWQRLEVVGDGGGMAIGHVAEHPCVAVDPSGAIAAVDGEIVLADRTVSGADAAREILRLEARGELGGEPLDGWYSAVLWRPGPRELVLLTDRMGHRPLYRTRLGGATVAASELKALVSAGVPRAIDLQTWAEILTFEHAVADGAPLAGVVNQAPATSVTVGPFGEERVEERWHLHIAPAEGADQAALVAELGERLAAAVARRVDRGTALALSGGLDSRCLAAVLQGIAPGALTATYGAIGSPDLRLGEEVAGHVGLAHRSLPLEPGYIARGAASTVWLTEGAIRCFHAHHLALGGLRAQSQVRSVLIGFSGDGLLRGRMVLPGVVDEDGLRERAWSHWAMGVTESRGWDALTPEFAEAIAGRARAASDAALAAERGDLPGRRLQAVLRGIYPRSVYPGSELFRDDVAPRDPFDDRDVVELCRRLPIDLRFDGALQRAFLRGFPALARITSPKDGIAPGVRGPRRAMAQKVKAGRSRLRARMERMFGLDRLPPGPGGGLGDYSADLRAEGAALLGILLEERTLDRGQLAEAGVRRMIDATLAGRARHTHELGMLVTLELFQRLFIDGDPPDGAVEVAEVEEAVPAAI